MMPWVERFLPVGESGVREFERLLGHALPSDYFEFLAQAKGWWLTIAAIISVPGVSEPFYITDFYVVTSEWVRGPDEEYLVPDIRHVRKEVFNTSVPEEFLVIADSHRGQFVMDLRSESYGEILFRDTFRHHINDDPFLDEEFFEKQFLDPMERFAYVKVAKNFSGFIKKIEFKEEEE